MMAFIYNDFKKRPVYKDHLSLGFFFHGRGTTLQKTAIGMFRSLLYQLYKGTPLVRKPIQEAFKENSYAGEAGKAWEWQLKELEHLFFDAVVGAAKSQSITIFVD